MQITRRNVINASTMLSNATASRRFLWFGIACVGFSSVIVSFLQQRQQKQQQYDYRAGYEVRLLLPRTNLRTAGELPRVSARVAYLSPWNGTDRNHQNRSKSRTALAPPTMIRYHNSSTSGRVRMFDQTRFYANGDSGDFRGMERRHWPDHPFQKSCVPMHKWQSQQFPVCNRVHELDLRVNTVHERISIINGNGFWRNAWKYEEDTSKNNTNLTSSNTTTVWKTFKLEHDMEEAFFENTRVDALAMERLTASPYVIDLYAFCGMTVVTEFAGRETAQVVNELNSTERLQLAVNVTQGISDIHSIGGDDPGDGEDLQPSLAHNDINLGNLIFSQDNRPLWNDFNIAILLMKDRDTGDTCKFKSHFPNPQWRAPEEQVYSEAESDSKPPIVTEKVDIYALGNVFYRLAVGGSPWKQPGAKSLSPEEKMEVARLKRVNGTLPSVPEEIRNTTDPAIQTILQAMYHAYEPDPIKRPNATFIASFLKSSLDRIQ